jgi:hypothetical protein
MLHNVRVMKIAKRGRTYANTVTFLKLRRKSKFAQVETDYTMVKYVCQHKDVQLKSNLHYTCTWSAAAWPPRYLCYRPAVFFCQLRLTALLFSQEKIRRVFKKRYYFNIYFF